MFSISNYKLLADTMWLLQTRDRPTSKHRHGRHITAFN